MFNLGRFQFQFRTIGPTGLVLALVLLLAGVGEAQTVPTPQTVQASVPPPPAVNPPVAAQKAAPAPAAAAQVAATVQAPTAQPVAVNVPGQTVIVQQSAPQIYVIPAPAPTVTVLQAPTAAVVHAQPTLTGFVTPTPPAAPGVALQQVAPIQQVQYLVAAPYSLPTYAPVAAAVPPASAASPLLVEVVPAGVLGRMIGGFGTRLSRAGYARVPVTTTTTTTTTLAALPATAPKHQWLRPAVAPVYAPPAAPAVDDSGWDPRFTEPLMQSVRPTPQVQTRRRLFGH